jgi:8-oxo-dGTP pyrophosphatase MutT (NUDIX family)
VWPRTCLRGRWTMIATFARVLFGAFSSALAPTGDTPATVRTPCQPATPAYSQLMSPVIRARRLAYRVAAQLLRVLRPLVPIDWGGVKCVLTDGDRVLLVRHTYGSRAWDLPGGGRRRGEPPAAAARREMHEELGIDGVPWRPLGQLHARAERYQQTIQIYGAEVSDPMLTLDLGEIAVACWFRLDGLPPDISRLVLPILDGAGLR